MLGLLESVHGGLSRLPKCKEPCPESLGELLERVKRVLDEVAPRLLQGVELLPQEVLWKDAQGLRVELRSVLDLPTLRARAAWYAVAEEEDVAV